MKPTAASVEEALRPLSKNGSSTLIRARVNTNFPIFIIRFRCWPNNTGQIKICDNGDFRFGTVVNGCVEGSLWRLYRDAALPLSCCLRDSLAPGVIRRATADYYRRFYTRDPYFILLIAAWQHRQILLSIFSRFKILRSMTEIFIGRLQSKIYPSNSDVLHATSLLKKL